MPVETSFESTGENSRDFSRETVANEWWLFDVNENGRFKNRVQLVVGAKGGAYHAAAANSFQAGKGATGVIGHNLVDSLIYKQSLMKFLVFINNVLQPRAALAPGVGIGTLPGESHHPLPYPPFTPHTPFS